MPLTAENRIQLARTVNLDLRIRNIDNSDAKIQELLRLLVLPAAAQNAYFRDALTRVKTIIQTQKTDAPNQRAAQDASWDNDLAVMADIEAGL